MGRKMHYDKGATRHSGWGRVDPLIGRNDVSHAPTIAGQSRNDVAMHGIVFRHDYVNGGYRAIQVNAPFLEGRGATNSAALFNLRVVIGRWKREKANENAGFDNLSPKA